MKERMKGTSKEGNNEGKKVGSEDGWNECNKERRK